MESPRTSLNRDQQGHEHYDHIGLFDTWLAKHSGSPFMATVRAAQINAVMRFTPWTMMANILNVTIIAILLWPVANLYALLLWAALTIAVSLAGLYSWMRTRQRGAPKRASIRAIRRATIHAGILSTLWAVVPTFWFSMVDHTGRMVISSLATGMICAGGFALATIPSGALLYVVILAAGSSIALMAVGELSVVAMGCLLAIYSVIVMGSVINTARHFLDRFTAEAALMERGQVIGLLLHDFEENASDWLFEIDCDYAIKHSGRRFENVAQLTAEELDGLNFLSLLGESSRQKLADELAKKTDFRDLVVNAQVGGEQRWWSLSVTPLTDVDNNVVGFRGVGSDITDTKTADDQISWMARFDPLTHLPNRTHFLHLATEALATATLRGTGLALVYLDLDHFKTVNDTLGHPFGDQLLCNVAARLRAFENCISTIGRLGGDEFALIITGVDKRDQVDRLVGEVIDHLSRPYFVDGTRAVIGASAGIAFAPLEGCHVDELVRNSDLALYDAKENGRGRLSHFRDYMHREASERRKLQLDMLRAIEREEFQILYQPIIDVSTSTIVAFEGLLRWHHPERGLLLPDLFIDIAEASGLIERIGEWVIRQACADAMQWPSRIRVAVNVSPAQFNGAALLNTVTQALADSGLQPDRLEIEITEALFLQNNPDTTVFLDQLKTLGVRIALDDFGTGYSSLGYLSRFYVHKIKIDRSFIHGRGPLKQREAIIKAVIAMANSLSMCTTAEGVETSDQFDWITGLNCDQVQGFLISRPIAFDQTLDLIESDGVPQSLSA